MSYLLGLVISLPAILIVITVHEYFHGYVAYRLGDPTAKFAGRLSLNPIKHIDPIGFIAFLIFRLGWAKPVPVNPYNFRDMKKGMIYTSVAGPLSNFLFAIPFGILLRLFPALSQNSVLMPLGLIVGITLQYNLILCAFNLIPIPPLDGSKVFFNLLPPQYARVEYWFERYGLMILLGLLFVDVVLGIPVLWGWIRPFVSTLSGFFASAPALKALGLAL